MTLALLVDCLTSLDFDLGFMTYSEKGKARDRIFKMYFQS